MDDGDQKKEVMDFGQADNELIFNCLVPIHLREDKEQSGKT